MKHVIHLYGASGSGTSALGRYIGQKTGAFFMDTDDYYWEETDPPYTVKRNVPERLARMESDLAKHDSVIIAGALAGWGDPLIPLFTLAIRVVTETAVRLERLRERELAHFGPRICAGGDMEQQHREFLAWAAAYETGSPDMRSRQKHDRWEQQLPCPIIKVDGSAPFEHNFLRIFPNGAPWA